MQVCPPEFSILIQAIRRAATSRSASGEHDDRTLATQLEGHRRQGRRRGGHDLAADLGAPPGEQRVVEALRQQILGDRRVALDHTDGLGVEVLRNQARNQRRGGRREL